MKHYFAPLEGITGYIYRNAHQEFFGGIDKYFMPFIVPSKSKSLAPRELSDVRPEHNGKMQLVPQILTNHAEGFIWAVGELKKMGYREVNLNLGCPSKTVVSKKRGAGFLAYPQELTSFLDEIFKIPDIKISVKTRIGKEDPEEFDRLLEIFNCYPMEELIIHPRLQKDFYKNKPDMEAFSKAVLKSKNPLCYNGDIFTAEAHKTFTEEFPQIDRIMLGRGLIANPGLAEEISDGRKIDLERFEKFHDRVLDEYQTVMSGDRNVLFKMKELWLYMGEQFPNSDKYLKKIKKAERLADYKEAVDAILSEQRHKKALLVVSFGTSYRKNSEKTIGAIETALSQAFPDYDVKRAFTSPTIRKILKERDEVEIDDMETALEKLRKEGYREVLLQPTYMICGIEYDKMMAVTQRWVSEFERFLIGTPALLEESDFEELKQTILEETSSFNREDTAVVLLGHGTEHQVNDVYKRMEICFKQSGYERYVVGTIEAAPALPAVVEAVKQTKVKHVVLLPLMIVAGEHANQDMAGDKEDSFKNAFKSAGFEVTCIMKGLGEYDGVQKLFVKHAMEAKSF